MLAFNMCVVGFGIIVLFSFDVDVFDRDPVFLHALFVREPHTFYRGGEIQSKRLQVRVELEIRVELFPDIPVVVQV